MTDKLLIFASWLAAGINAAGFISLICRFSPGLRIPIVLLLGAALLILGIISFFSPSTRPWIALVATVVLIGGSFAWLL